MKAKATLRRLELGLDSPVTKLWNGRQLIKALHFCIALQRLRLAGFKLSAQSNKLQPIPQHVQHDDDAYLDPSIACMRSQAMHCSCCAIGGCFQSSAQDHSRCVFEHAARKEGHGAGMETHLREMFDWGSREISVCPHAHPLLYNKEHGIRGSLRQPFQIHITADLLFTRKHFCLHLPSFSVREDCFEWF